ncbi:MAG TPA: DUF1269 domain-containing protein [Ktedonobacterales bacterium]|nr:DUF1269 domain-containing protein [Ktedonobacterales bacterium]
MAGQTELVVIRYDGEQRAAQAAEALNALHRERAVDLRNVAIISRDHSGNTHIRETNDPTTGEGALLGALIGGIVGWLKDRPIQGAALGAAGGYLAGRLLDLGFDDTTLRAIASSLTPNSSALAVAIEIRDVDATAQCLAPFRGTILRDTSVPSQAARLAAAIEQGSAPEDTQSEAV